MLHLKDLHEDTNLDDLMERGRYIGFCIHNDRDVMLCGLNSIVAADAFRIVAKTRNATSVVDEAKDMISIVKVNAKKESKTFKITDDYTTRFCYSVNQLCPLRATTNPQLLVRIIARGGPAQVHFKKNKKSLRQKHDNLLTSRAELRMQMVEEAEKVSNDFINWRSIKRPRVTSNSQINNTYTRAPFTLDASLPNESNEPQVRLSMWESSLRGIEEHLMISIFGMLPNIIWASILAKILRMQRQCWVNLMSRATKHGRIMTQIVLANLDVPGRDVDHVFFQRGHVA